MFNILNEKDETITVNSRATHILCDYILHCLGQGYQLFSRLLVIYAFPCPLQRSISYKKNTAISYFTSNYYHNRRDLIVPNQNLIIVKDTIAVFTISTTYTALHDNRQPMPVIVKQGSQMPVIVKRYFSHILYVINIIIVMTLVRALCLCKFKRCGRT